MLTYQRQLLLILILMITIMSFGIYGTGYNMRKNTLEPVPAIISWERRENGISVHFIGLDYTTGDGALVIDSINSSLSQLEAGTKPALEGFAAKCEDYRHNIKIFFEEVAEIVYSYAYRKN